mgnify:CR=1 FL=1|tara:strand:+ start:12 stop:473 length:462 start_codon:yes stop_codon:yes gene_type:complete
MIEFKNPQNINVFESFIDRYQNLVNANLSADNITIGSINEHHQLFNAVATKDDPFATNSEMQPVVIAINEIVCKKLDFTEEEQHAMIAHEIGHILDQSPRQENIQLDREYNADKFAIELGLSKELKTGLVKIIESGNYSEEINDIQKRINNLN